MTAQIAHLGVLVENLEEAIDRWSKALGYTFSAPIRYVTDSYTDHSQPGAHHHDARIAVSHELPMVELMEFHGEGTHSAKNGEGFHHFGFVDTPDLHARMDELAALGVGHDGVAVNADGQTHLWFTESRDLNGMRLEFVGLAPSPIVGDDHTELPRREDGWVELFSPEPAESAAPRIHHFGVLVEDLEGAIERWKAVTGWEWDAIGHYRTDNYSDFSDREPHHHDARTAMSTNEGPKIELMEFHGNGTHSGAQGEGLHHVAFIQNPDLAGQREHFANVGIGIQGGATDDSGADLLFFTEPADLDGIRLEIVDVTRQHPIYREDGTLVDASDLKL